jgi:hypothetical protein
VPHVNDARRMEECARLLGSPLRAELRARAGGRRPIDAADPGQQEFQALLLACLLSPHRSLSWDTKTGRSFREMHAYYSWASPQPDRLATGWTVAARVASYLLPSAAPPEQDGPGFAGIPGLRLARLTRPCIELAHLPTGGRLELHDNMWNDLELRASTFDTEIRDTNGMAHDGPRALWMAPEVSAEEAAGLAAEWTMAAHAPVLSAVMARIHVLWRHWDTGLRLAVNPVTGLPRLSWDRGPALASIAHLLADPSSAICVPGTRLRHRRAGTIVLSIGGAALEFRGPADDSS